MNPKECPDCGARLDPGEKCDCKSEDAPGGAGASSDENGGAIGSGTTILSSLIPYVNDLFNLSELRDQTGVQAKELSLVIAERFPHFSRQIFTQCANPEKYGCIPHPDLIRLIREKYNLPVAKRSIPPPAGGKLTQCEKVLRHMRDYGSITSLEAMTEYGIMRLASRISDLKKRGYDICSVMEAGKNRYGEPTVYARYSLIGG